MNNKPDSSMLFVVRLFDIFDGWIDITEPLTLAEAEAVWNEATKNGTHLTKNHYRISPSGMSKFLKK